MMNENIENAEFIAYSNLQLGKEYAWDTLKEYLKLSSEEKLNLFGGEKKKLVQVLNEFSADELHNLLVEKRRISELPKYYAYVDGSYNDKTGMFGYGGIVCVNGKKTTIQGSSDDKEMASMRNVAGEIMGVMHAITEAADQGLPSITIFYDYIGLEKWATGEWKRTKKWTIRYHDFIERMRKVINISFVKVKAHSGIDGNEEADRLAKESVGLIKSDTNDTNSIGRVFDALFGALYNP